MRTILLALCVLLGLHSRAQLAAHAGGTASQGDSIPFTMLSGFATGGTPPYTYAWTTVTKPNGNDWCGNILNPTSAATQVLYTGVFSSPFRTAYTYRLKVTDALSATATDVATVNVVYSSLPPPISTGPGWHYVTGADSLADPLKQMSPTRKDIWINGANTDAYGAGGRNTTIDIRNAFSVHNDTRIFISGSTTKAKYLAITLQIHKDSVLNDSLHPFRIVPWGGKVEWIDQFTALGCWKNFVINGGYDIANNTGSPLYLGLHVAFPSGTYGFQCNNNWRNIDAAGFNFGGADSLHNGEIAHCEGPNGGSYFLLMGNNLQSAPCYSIKIHDNYGRGSRVEMIYGARTQSDPQSEFSNVEIYNNIWVRAGLEMDQFGQNGQWNYIHNNVAFLAAMNRNSPFDINQAFNSQRFWRKNGNQEVGNIWVGSGEQARSDVSNKPTAVTLTSDTNVMRKCIIFNTAGSKDIFNGAQNAAPFHFVYDSVYMGYRPNIYQMNRIYNGTSNNFAGQPYAILNQQNFPGTPITITFRHIRYDSTGGKTRMDAAGVTGMTYQDTLRVNSLPPLNFVNTGFANNSTLPNNISRWIDTIYNTFKDETPGLTSVNQNQPFSYSVGDYVEHCGWIYQSNVNNNQGHPPAGVTDAFWTRIDWFKPDGTLSHEPPDDLRLPYNDSYALQGIGLTDQQPPTNRVRKGRGRNLIR